MNRTTKVVYNDSHCPFTISPKAICWLFEHGSGDLFDCRGHFLLKRHHPLFVKCIETLGDLANGWTTDARGNVSVCAFEIAEVPGSYYYIENHDGLETVIGLRDMEHVTEQ